MSDFASDTTLLICKDEKFCKIVILFIINFLVIGTYDEVPKNVVSYFIT